MHVGFYNYDDVAVALDAPAKSHAVSGPNRLDHT
jgi:CheY-like chemotaxis protein